MTQKALPDTISFSFFNPCICVCFLNCFLFIYGILVVYHAVLVTWEPAIKSIIIIIIYYYIITNRYFRQTEHVFLLLSSYPSPSYLQLPNSGLNHDGVIKWKHFLRNWPFVRGIHRGQRPVTRGLMFSLICPNKRLSKHWWGWWFETPSCPLWRHCNDCKPNLLLRYVVWKCGNIWHVTE